jgi:hypothetical protein
VIYQSAILSDRRPRIGLLVGFSYEILSREHARHAPISQTTSRSVYAASLFLQLRQLLFETADPIGEIVIGRTVHRLGLSVKLSEC